MRRILALVRTLDSAAEWLLFDVLFSPRWRAKTLVALTLAAGLALGWTWDRTSPTPAAPAMAAEQLADGKLLFKRPWIDRKPRDYRDKFAVYVFSDEEIDDGLYVGGVVIGIPVKFLVEYYGFKPSGNRLNFWFPADDSKAASGFKITKEKNGQFDLKLVLESDPRHGGRAHTYYGRMDGELDIPGVNMPTELTRHFARK